MYTNMQLNNKKNDIFTNKYDKSVKFGSWFMKYELEKEKEYAKYQYK